MQWTVKEFDEEYLPIINEWLRKRKSPEVSLEELPAVGFVAGYQDNWIAAGFLLQTENGHAIIDSLASNPDFDGHSRHVAIDLVVQAIISSAKTLGLTSLLAYTVDVGTLERALRHGFAKLPHTLIALDLKNGPSH
jgi:hypothetical protein